MANSKGVPVTVSIRLQRHGKTKQAYYRIVATNKTSKRDGKYLEILGTFNPMIEPPAVTIKEERVKHWVSVGAEVLGITRKIIKNSIPGLIENRDDNQRSKIQLARKKRKARLAETTKAKK